MSKSALARVQERKSVLKDLGVEVMVGPPVRHLRTGRPGVWERRFRLALEIGDWCFVESRSEKGAAVTASRLRNGKLVGELRADGLEIEIVASGSRVCFRVERSAD